MTSKLTASPEVFQMCHELINESQVQEHTYVIRDYFTSDLFLFGFLFTLAIIAILALGVRVFGLLREVQS